MIITISGKCGSGKTTIGKALADRLGYRFYSIGELRGKLALQQGLTIDQLNRLGESKSWTDAQIDRLQRAIGLRENDVVVDGKLAWHFIPQSFRIFLDIEPEIAAERIFEQIRKQREARPDERTYSSKEEVLAEIAEREASDDKRYKKWYSIDWSSPKHYDLVIDTSRLSKEEVLQTIIEVLEKKFPEEIKCRLRKVSG